MGTLRLGLLPMPHRSLSGRALFRAKPVLRTSVLSCLLTYNECPWILQNLCPQAPGQPSCSSHPVISSDTQFSAQTRPSVCAVISSLGSFGLCPALFDIPDKLLPHPLSPNFNVSSVKPFQTVSTSSLPMGCFFVLFCFFLLKYNRYVIHFWNDLLI